MKIRSLWLGLSIALLAESAMAQMMMRPPAFAGGIPGRASMDAIFMQRHQARTLLYREALEELRKNPQAADLPICGAGISGPCLATDKSVQATPPTVGASVAKPALPVDTPPVAVVPAKKPAVSAPTVVPKAVPEAPTISAQAPEKPSEETVVKKVAPPTPKEGRRIALLFGNNDYATPIPPLETPIADVSEIAAVLTKRFGFSTQVIKNAGQAKIIEELNRVAATVGPEDSVLLFYAGHGYLMDDIGMGFWIPVDASVKTAKGWISNKDISKLLGAIPAHQLILISDSCFSGTLTKEQKVAEGALASPETLSQRRSVVVLSSGGDEPVSDEGKDGHSIFAWNLIRELKGMGALTPGVRVWKTVHGEVKKDYPQEPQYGAVVSAGHVAGGDYLFLPK
ncbi:MAG: filamentous hemagglutinin family outer membrane protein [Proteobacteria bacterium]|nr:filamentous hemagglutinin family outer membrane protein [Pseudomonadota bacterium]